MTCFWYYFVALKWVTYLRLDAHECDRLERLSLDDEGQWESREDWKLHVTSFLDILDFLAEGLADNRHLLVGVALHEVHVGGVEDRQDFEEPSDGGTALWLRLEALGRVAEVLLDGEVDLVDQHVLGWWLRAGQRFDLSVSGAVGLAPPHGEHLLLREPIGKEGGD